MLGRWTHVGLYIGPIEVIQCVHRVGSIIVFQLFRVKQALYTASNAIIVNFRAFFRYFPEQCRVIGHMQVLIWVLQRTYNVSIGWVPSQFFYLFSVKQALYTAASAMIGNFQAFFRYFPEQCWVIGHLQVLIWVLQRSYNCLLYTSPSPRDVEESRMPSSA